MNALARFYNPKASQILRNCYPKSLHKEQEKKKGAVKKSMPPPSQNHTPVSTSNDDRILLEMLAKKLGDLAPLHGDMIKLLTTVENMKTNESDLKRFKDKIMDPENGLFSKIQSVEHNIEIVENQIDSMQKGIDSLPRSKDLDNTDNSIHDLRKDHDAIKKLLEDVGGKNLEELNAIVKLKANMSRVYWALIISVIISVGKILFDLLKTTH